MLFSLGAGTEWELEWEEDSPCKIQVRRLQSLQVRRLQFPVHAYWSLNGDEFKTNWGEFGNYMPKMHAEGASLWQNSVVSFPDIYATTCQHDDLIFVSFPVQLIRKCFKMMPVMVWGVIVFGKSYGATKLLIAGAVTGGVTKIVLMTAPISRNDDSTSTYSPLLLRGGWPSIDYIDFPAEGFQGARDPEVYPDAVHQPWFLHISSSALVASRCNSLTMASRFLTRYSLRTP